VNLSFYIIIITSFIKIKKSPNTKTNNLNQNIYVLQLILEFRIIIIDNWHTFDTLILLWQQQKKD